jgi:hypothetical protein
MARSRINENRWAGWSLRWQVVYKAKRAARRVRDAIKGFRRIGRRRPLVCGGYDKVLVITINHHHAGFFAYFIFALNQLRYCERHNYLPVVYFGEKSGAGLNAYYDRQHGENMWDYYFEPVAGLRYTDLQGMVKDPQSGLRQEDVIELTSEDLWYLHLFDPESIYGYTYGRYRHKREYDAEWYEVQRAKARDCVDTYVRVKEPIRRIVDEFYDAHMDGCDVLGVHIRGTDKGAAVASSNVQRIVGPEAYITEIDAYLREHPQCKIFLATDQTQFLEMMKQRYADRILYRDAKRSSTNLNPFQVQDGEGYRKGEDALVDCLLLSKCDFLLKCTSHLSETALYFNRDLKCLDLNYAERSL